MDEEDAAAGAGVVCPGSPSSPMALDVPLCFLPWHLLDKESQSQDFGDLGPHFGLDPLYRLHSA